MIASLLLHLSRHVTSEAGGSRMVPVTCERCGTAYFYELARSGRGGGVAPLFVEQEAAKARAAARAVDSLRYRLGTERDVVPCPACHWINADMVEEYRRRAYPWASTLAWVIASVGVGGAWVTAVVLMFRFGVEDRRPWAVGGAIAAVAVIATVGLVATVARARRRLDANAAFPQPPVLPRNTPPALVPGPDPITGEPTLLLANSARPKPVDRHDDVGAVVFLPARLPALPDVCCGCLTPSPRSTLRGPATPRELGGLSVPLCDPCHWRARAKSRAALAWVIGLAVLGAAVAAATSAGTDGFARGVLIGGAVVAGLAVARAVGGRSTRPYRVEVLDRGRGVVRFAAANPGYTARVAEAVRSADAGEARLV